MTILSRFRFALAFVFLFIAGGRLFALPIGFGQHQGEIEYSEIITEDFYLYFDSQAEKEGRMFAATLQSYTKILERWLEVQRQDPLLIISSSRASNASFANFITDAIELQTWGIEDRRDLILHELTHTLMYSHFRNFLGPAGSIMYLPWLPAWWIEGLAEVMSVSSGSDHVSGIERRMALKGTWPSYDRLHSLYHAKFAYEGYAVAGNFTRFILRRLKDGGVGSLLRSMRDYSEPWWWPWTVVPFNGFLPVDEALRERLGKGPEELYEDYKREAKAYWSAQAKTKAFTERKGKRLFLKSSASLQVRSGDAFVVESSDGRYQEAKLEFNRKTGWADRSKSASFRFPKSTGSTRARLVEEDVTAAVESEIAGAEEFYHVFIQSKSGRSARIEKVGIVERLWRSGDTVYWLAESVRGSQVCGLPLSELTPRTHKVDREGVACLLTVGLPTRLRFIAGFPSPEGKGRFDKILVSEETQTELGDRFRLVELDLRKRLRSDFQLEDGAKPLAGRVLAGGEIQLLVSERNRQSLRKLDASGRCLGRYPLEDLTFSLHPMDKEHFVLSFYEGKQASVLRLADHEVSYGACIEVGGPTSPLIEAKKHGAMTNFTQALTLSDPWARYDKPIDLAQLRAADGLGEGKSAKSIPQSQPRQWRARPVFAFPWIGADDAYGTQLGAVSVPLMDHLQNETVRLTALYGLESRYPSADLVLESRRFAPRLALTAFRRQVYNGSFQGNLLYYDEKGVFGEIGRGFMIGGHRLDLGMLVKSSHLEPYIGPTQVRKGRLNEFGLGLEYYKSFSWIRVSAELAASWAPGSLNREFDYNKLAAITTLSHGFDFLKSTFSLGLEGSRTRGKERRFLTEVYRPLKTFVPGSGGGYNKNSFLLSGEGNMFSPQFGDTQARGKAAYTFPLISEIEKQLWILYLDRLDFTAFYNYGGSWYGSSPPEGRLLSAHGYNVDLLFENKGVNFNLGGGVGQVLGEGLDIYLTGGFDAFF